MKGNSILGLLIPALLAWPGKFCQAQYFQWAKNYSATLGVIIHGFAVDPDGNSCQAGESKLSASSSAFRVVKLNSSGKQQWKKEITGANAGFAVARAVAFDGFGNIYAVGTWSVPGTPLVFDSLHTTSNAAFLVKFSSQGKVLQLDSIGNNPATDYTMTTDSSGNIYVSDGFSSRKYNAGGILVWHNTSYGGAAIGVDKNKRVFLLNANSLTRLTFKGDFSWSQPYGGNSLAVDDNGNCFIASDDSIFKISPAGGFLWSNPGLHGNSIALDDNGKIYLALGNSLRKLQGNGTTVTWSLSTQNAYCLFIATGKANCLVAGEYNPMNEVVICPFHFQRVGIASPDFHTRAFVTKVNQTGAIPFQAGIYTPPIPGDRLCTGVFFQVPYLVSLNSVSAFGTGNQFRAQLINPASGDTTDIGLADSAYIPGNVLPSTGCRVRVVSTNPVIIGDENSPQLLTNDLALEPLVSGLNPAGQVSLCNGSDVQLHAVQGPFNAYYYWYKNNLLFSGGAFDTVKTVTASGTYFYSVYTSDYNCSLSSDSLQLSLQPSPVANVTASGPLSFCNGDSVVLSTQLVAGNSYQWKKNNVNISGATLSAYVAKASGTFKVKVTGPNGCTAISAGKTVQVNCRDSGAESAVPDVLIYEDQTGLRLVVSGIQAEVVRIFSTQGGLIREWKLSGELPVVFDTENIHPGVYIVQVRGREGVWNEKIVIR